MRAACDNITFSKWLDAQAGLLGFEAIACLRLDSSLAGKLAPHYSAEALYGMPPYVARDAKFKTSPAEFAPWAKSALIALGSFRALPKSPSFELFKFSKPSSPTAGLLAGYDLKLDYHIFSRDAMRRLSSALSAEFGEARAMPICDSNPLPERALAVLAGLGRPGLHRCLLASSSRDGVFISSLLSELELPERVFPEDPASFCNMCGACVPACPNGAIGGKELPFDYSRCIVAISSEMRGPLSLEQTKALGFWLAGCGECVRECPRSKLPPPEAVDLEWLLSCPSSELEKAIAPTSLSYEGATLLRRNALAVLSNRGEPESLALIQSFGERTGSAKLKSFARLLLERQGS